MIENIADLALNVIAVGGGGALVAWGLFKYLGENWIKNRLAKDLELAKSEIYLLSSRRMKLHDKEYEVFPELWARLVKTGNSIAISVMPIKITQDFSRMSDEDMRQWLSHRGFTKEEVSDFLKSGNKDKALIIIEHKNLNAAIKCFCEFREYLQVNRIFLRPEIKGKFDRIEGLLEKSLQKRMLDLDHKDDHDPAKPNFLKKAYDTFENEVKPLMREVELLVQNKLFPESKTGSGGEKEND